MRQISIVISLLASLSTLSFGRLSSENCNYKLFPVFAGGSKVETVKCVGFDD